MRASLFEEGPRTRVGFAVEAGKLTALWVGGKGEASLTVTLEWSERPGAPVGGDG